jgi:hypothetical protein
MGGRLDDFTHDDYLDSEQTKGVQNEAILIVVFVVFGLYFLIKGITGLDA